jgi:hypothetical protein
MEPEEASHVRKKIRRWVRAQLPKYTTEQWPPPRAESEVRRSKRFDSAKFGGMNSSISDWSNGCFFLFGAQDYEA